MEEQGPRLNPSRRATDDNIREDMLIFGVAFVVDIDGERWMLHPMQVSVYSEKDEDDE